MMALPSKKSDDRMRAAMSVFIEDAIRRPTAAPSFWSNRCEVCSTIPTTKASCRSVNRNVVFGGFWKRLEVLGTLLELPYNLGGSGGPRLSVCELKCRLLTLYAECCMLSVVCCMLRGMLYDVYCMLFCKLLEMPKFLQVLFKNLSNLGCRTDPKWVPGGFLGRPGALGRDHVASGSILH